MKNPNYTRLCTTVGALVLCGSTAAFSQPVNWQLPAHLAPARSEARTLIYNEGRAADAIAFLHANQEYLQHPNGQGRFFMSLAHMMLGDWNAAYQWAIPPGWNDLPRHLWTCDYRNLLDAFNGNLDRAFEGLSVDLSTYGESQPVFPYLAQGDSDAARKANIAYIAATGSFARSAVERYLLTVAFQLAPDAPLIRMRYAGRAEPDVRKAVAILDGLSFPQHKRLQEELGMYQRQSRRALQRAERGELPFILPNRVLPHPP